MSRSHIFHQVGRRYTSMTLKLQNLVKSEIEDNFTFVQGQEPFWQTRKRDYIQKYMERNFV